MSVMFPSGSSHADAEYLVSGPHGVSEQIEARIRDGASLQEALERTAVDLREYLADLYSEAGSGSFAELSPATGKRLDSQLSELLIQPFGCLEEYCSIQARFYR